jgi:hypothetical protein
MISDILGFSMEAHGDPWGPNWDPMGTPWPGSLGRALYAESTRKNHTSRMNRFRQKLSRETLEKSNFMILKLIEKSLRHRIPPNWSLETPAVSRLILGGPWMLPK